MRDATGPATRCGFSLVELLVVICVIAVLSALLFPVYVSAKNSALRGDCQSNLRQIAEAFEAYVSDYDDCYPCKADNPSTEEDESDPLLWTGRHWRWPMRKYLGFYAAYDFSDGSGANQITGRTNTILRCPADPNPTQQYDKTSYGYSFAFYHTPDQISRMSRGNTLMTSEPDESLRPRVVNNAMVRWPSKKALVAEWMSAHSEVSVNWWSWGGRRNYLFADGHVDYLSARKIRPSSDSFPDINLTTNGVAGTDVN